LTGITYEQLLREGGDATATLTEFFEFIGDLPMVSHNADFDYGFIGAACKKAGLTPFNNRCIDTLTLARRRVKGVANYKLETLAKHFQFETGAAHRSVDDCLTTMRLYEELQKIE
jgi:DNA polymerase III epsilon subunit-like protein